MPMSVIPGLRTVKKGSAMNPVRKSVRRLAIAVSAIAALAVGVATAVPALAASVPVPVTPDFGASIEPLAAYVRQTTCDPTEKPGPVGVRALLNDTYSLNRTGNIVRACDVGDTSEHKEGRALDYMLDTTDSGEKAIGDAIVNWLLATDKYGNKWAVARRLGIMYVIWNRQIWSSSRASEGWRDYTGDNPHTDHIHLSFSWDGAKKQTSWWTMTPLPSTPPRIGIVTTAGAALVKEGGLSATWTTEYSNVRQVVVDGDRIGVLTTDGVALVKEGGLSATWTTEYSGVQQLALAGDRMGVLTTGGVALVKEGGLSATWTTEYSGVQQLALMTDRVGVLTTAGVALVKEGGLSNTWTTEYSDVQQLALSDDRIGIVTTAGVALVKDGGLSALWTTEYSGVRQVVLAHDRVGIVTTAGVALVKEGGLSTTWTTEYSGIQGLALS
jgi:hypothetical protein